jgi:hypothetical protein
LFGSLFTVGLNWIPVVFPTGIEVALGAGFRAMETPGADWLDWLEWLLPPHAARKQIAASKRNGGIRRLATTANLRLNNMNVINGVA